MDVIQITKNKNKNKQFLFSFFFSLLFVVGVDGKIIFLNFFLGIIISRVCNYFSFCMCVLSKGSQN